MYCRTRCGRCSANDMYRYNGLATTRCGARTVLMSQFLTTRIHSATCQRTKDRHITQLNNKHTYRGAIMLSVPAPGTADAFRIWDRDLPSPPLPYHSSPSIPLEVGFVNPARGSEGEKLQSRSGQSPATNFGPIYMWVL